MVVSSIRKDSRVLEDVVFTALCSNQFDSEGNDKNNTYAKESPMATLYLRITNPALVGKFAKGQEFSIDFTLED